MMTKIEVRFPRKLMRDNVSFPPLSFASLDRKKVTTLPMLVLGVAVTGHKKEEGRKDGERMEKNRKEEEERERWREGMGFEDGQKKRRTREDEGG